MAEGWLGKSISIRCKEPSGAIFQGTIKEVSPEVITITRVIRDGVPVRKPEIEVKIASSNILSLELVRDSDTAASAAVPSKSVPENVASGSRKGQQPKTNGQSVANGLCDYTYQQQQQQPSRSSAKAVPKSPNNKKYFSSNMAPAVQQQHFERPTSAPSVDNTHQQQQMSMAPPLPLQKTNNNNPRGNNNGNRGGFQDHSKNNGRGRYQNSKHETFGTPVNDPTMDEDFDFEKNLALFDKQAVWEKFNQMNDAKPDLLHHQGNSHQYAHQRQPQPKYRHDENILQSAPTQYRGIEVDYNSSRDYVSDDGLIVPSIPLIVRNRLQTAAEAMGLTWERQIDILSRGVCDTALQLLGGAPRLKPNNRHQWPNIVVICEEPYNERKSEIGICTGRMLATHGLRVHVYVKELTQLSRMSYELDLFKATGNRYTCNIQELPSSDLIIISSRLQLSPDITKWIVESRAPVLSIDPPVGGFVKIPAKCSVLPILPLDDINMNTCGKLYLCNLCIPDKFFQDAGIKYSSPFGHKNVISIHPCD